MNKPDIRFNGFNEEWLEKTFEDLVDVQSGRDYKHLSEGTIPVYGTGGYMLSVDEALSYNEDAVGIGRKGTIDKPYILKAPFWTVDTLFYSIPKNKMNLDFIFSAFQTIRWKDKDESTGVPSLSKNAINSTEIKIPNESAEQKKLGALFSQIDSLIASTQKEHDKLVALKKCMLQKMFPKKGSLVPEIRFEGFSGDWVEKKLGEVVQEFYNGKTPYRGNSEYWNGNVNWIASGDLNRGIVTKTAETITELGKNDNNLRILNKGTVVIAIMGLEAKGTRGNCGILGIESTINQACMAIIPSDELDSQFFFAWYKSVAEEYGTKYTQGTKQQNLNARILSDFDIKVPTVEEQQKIGSYFQNLDNLISKQSAELEKLKNVKKTLLSKMFV